MRIKSFFIFILITGSLSFSINSEEYEPPKLELKPIKKIRDVKIVGEKEFKDLGEASYRVEEDPDSQREVASEEKEKRGPSSSEEKPKSESPRPWSYKN